MARKNTLWPCVFVIGGFVTLCVGAVILVGITTRESKASVFKPCPYQAGCNYPGLDSAGCVTSDLELSGAPGGTWYWLRSPDDERRVIMGLYNRYCIRCHGVDGRGVWDIPGVPDFTNAGWQACRSDVQIVQAILEGRGAVMPPFRGTLTLEEGWGMARYLRAFVPGTEVSRPDFGQGKKAKAERPAPKKGQDRKSEQDP
jgi:mono/diheme cytochrome c family protein